MEGVLDVVLAGNSTACPADRGILVGAHVHNVVVTLVLNGACGVKCLQGIVGGNEVLAGTCLVTQRPDNDTSVVHVGVSHFHHTGNVGLLPLLGVRDGCLAVVVLVALDVCLVLQIDTVLVAEEVPVGVAGIVRVAHVVDVGALHQHNLFLLHFACDGMTNGRMALVAVYTLQFYGLAVDIVVAAGQTELVVLGLGVLDFHLTETYDGRNGLQHAALLVQKFAHQSVAVGSLGCPLAGFYHLQFGLYGSLAGEFVQSEGSTVCDNVSGLVVVIIQLMLVQSVAHLQVLDVLLGSVEQVGTDVQHAVLVVLVQVGLNHEVTHADGGTALDGHGAEDTGQTEHVLSLQERTVA